MDPSPPPPRFRAWATWALMAANAIVFGVMCVSARDLPILPLVGHDDTAQLLNAGANFGVLEVFEHQWWRAFTAMFVHIGLVHLAANLYALLQVGPFVERLWGRTYFLVAYLLTGLAGSFASVLHNPGVPSAGASAAIFGLFGVIVGFTIRARNLLDPEVFRQLRKGILLSIGINLVLALVFPFIDNAAHLGGLLTGVLAGVVATSSALTRPSHRPSLGSQAIVAAVALAIALLADARTRHSSEGQTLGRTWAALKAFDAGDYALAERKATEAIARKDEPRARWLRANAYERQGKREAALADITVAVEKSSTDATDLPYMLALKAQLEVLLGKDDEAGRDLARMSDLLPDSSDARQTMGIVAIQQGKYQVGISLLRQLRKKDPEDPSVANNLAWALAMTQSELDEALDASNLAVSKEPEEKAYLGTRCWVHALRNETELAIADCEAVLKLGDSPVDAGMLAYLKHDYAKAVSEWERAGQKSVIEQREMKPWIARAKENLSPDG